MRSGSCAETSSTPFGGAPPSADAPGAGAGGSLADSHAKTTSVRSAQKSVCAKRGFNDSREIAGRFHNPDPAGH